MNGSVYVFICIYISSRILFICVPIYTSLCICTHLHSLCACVHIPTQVCMSMFICICMSTQILFICVPMYTSLCICTHLHVPVYLCVRVYISTWLYACEWIPPLPPSTLTNQAPQCRQLAVAQRVKGGSQGHVCNTSILRYVSQ